MATITDTDPRTASVVADSEKDNTVQREAYNIEDAARILGVNYRTLRDAIVDGDFYAIRIRNRYVIPKAYIDHILSPKNAAISHSRTNRGT